MIPERVLFYRLIAPPTKKKELANFVGFQWPKKNNYKICHLANRVHVFLMNEFRETQRSSKSHGRSQWNRASQRPLFGIGRNEPQKYDYVLQHAIVQTNKIP